MDDLVLLALGRQTVDLAVDRERLIRQIDALQKRVAELEAKDLAGFPKGVQEEG